MGKISIQDLSGIIAERNGIDKKEASAFITAMFEIVQTQLNTEKFVKIKGLGTFKIVDVDDRESVDVNTGERVLIEGHGKISFVPDALMKELVNKPFSQFETVVLNEGVDFDETKKDVPEPEPEEDTNADPSTMALVDFGLGSVAADLSSFPIIEDVDRKNPSSEIPDETILETPQQEPQVTEKTVEAEVPVEMEQTVEEPVEPVSEQPDVEQPDQTNDVEQPLSQEASEPSATPVEENMTEEEEPRRPWLAVAIACLAGLLIGYVAGNYFPFTTSQESQQTVQAPPVVHKKQSVVKKETKQAVVDTSKAVAPIQAVVDTPKTSSTVQPVASEASVHDQYAAKDARVRLGAYRIVGTEKVVKVKEGETLYRISRRYLGPDMECYLEVYNNIKDSEVLKAGQEIKIPKLEVKRKKKSPTVN